jgi:hypothetical protein
MQSHGHGAAPADGASRVRTGTGRRRWWRCLRRCAGWRGASGCAAWAPGAEGGLPGMAAGPEAHQNDGTMRGTDDRWCGLHPGAMEVSRGGWQP